MEHRIAAYPNVSFTIVVNPFNGPGLDDLPDENYQREIPNLTCYANVRLVGYVHTTWANRDLALVLKDIDKYAQWPARSGIARLKVRGIFLDETPNAYDAQAELYLAKLRKHVKEMPGGEDNLVRKSPSWVLGKKLPPTQMCFHVDNLLIKKVIHNPGSVPDMAFLTLADSTIIFEDTYTTFQTRVSNAVFSATALSRVDRSKLACVIHSIPRDLGVEEWSKLGRQTRKIAGDLFLTDLYEHYYANFAPKWAEFVDAMAA